MGEGGWTFRLTDNLDPEERLEEAALWKAMHDEYGRQIRAVSSATPTTFGRVQHGEGSGLLAYWNDHAFLKWAARRFTTVSIDDLAEAVGALHRDGLGAFVKSTQSKHAIFRVPVGADPIVEMDAMVYSFIDGGPKLMVQELCRVEYEHRFFVINRKIVTSSPNAAHLTPLDYPQTYDYVTPSDAKHGQFCARGFLLPVAEDIAANMETPDAVIDCAIINGTPGCVELNPMWLGGVGLFACDVRALARHARYLTQARLATPEIGRGG